MLKKENVDHAWILYQEYRPIGCKAKEYMYAK